MLPVRRGVTVPALSATGTTTSPASTQVGDLVVCFLWSQNTAIPTHTVRAADGFVEVRNHSHDDGTTDGRASCAYKIATVAGAQSYQPFTISGANTAQIGVGCVVYQAGTFDVSSLPASNSATLTTNGVPNPPSIAALTGDFEVLAAGFWHVTTAGATQATAPTNYAIIAQNANTSHVTHLAIAARSLSALNNATEDPAAFGDNVAPNGSVSMTVAIKGAADPERTGSGSGSSSAQTGTGTATTRVTGAGAGSSSPQTGAGTGTVSDPPRTGAGSGSATSQAGTGAGTVAIAGSGQASSSSQAGLGAASARVAGSGGGSSSSQAGIGSATARVAGVGAASSSGQVGTGAGAVQVSGTGASSASSPAGLGSGDVLVTGSGAASSNSQTGSGSGWTEDPEGEEPPPRTGAGAGTSSRQTGAGLARAVVSGSGAGEASAQTGGPPSPDPWWTRWARRWWRAWRLFGWRPWRDHSPPPP